MYIPLMKDLNLTWEDIKSTPKLELIGLATALSEYNILHSFDGYSAKDIDEMAKDKPDIRRKYGVEKAAKSFDALIQ